MPITLVLCIDRAYFINVIQGKVRTTHLVLIFTSCERKSCEKRDSKNPRLWPCEKKGKRNPVYYITCRALWPALTSLHVILMRSRCFYYHLHKTKPRLRGQWVQTAKVELGVVPCLHPGLSWFHRCTCRFPESEDKSYGSFLSCTIKRKKLWNAAMFNWKAGLCLLPCQQWQSVFPCMVQRVNLSSLKCQEPHLLLHLKREYFALFFFFKSWFGLSVFVLQPSAQMPITRKMY